jgi:hypothetical protein
MSRRPSTLIRFVSWLAVTAMLLRVAVPMLAVGVAQLRGVAVGSVCAVYGVVLPDSTGGAYASHGHHHAEHAEHASHDGHDGHTPGSQETHSGDHCALTALAELGVSRAPMFGAATEGRHAIGELAPSAPPAWGDASATWAARRKQGPLAIA